MSTAPDRSASRLARDVGLTVHDARRALGWSQEELARRSDVSQAAVSRLEQGTRSAIRFDEIERIAIALGARIQLRFEAPFLLDRAQQRDRVHARCVGHVAKRLRASGWLVDTEVEIDGARGPGWIDVLAWHPVTRLLLVVEVKTEIHDFGRIQRTLAWYERRATVAARRRAWLPGVVRSALLLLATEAVDARLRDNRDLARQSFPGRARDLTVLVSNGSASADSPTHLLALIDPASRRADWLRAARIDGRRTAAPYEDYAAAARRLR
ncbi:MAG TPA: helix-turn-helix transcriptional regulator [Candidatus Deferrimicrobium sp.]|nr:helix-turn-helix transcriptional regulator [Candidatus Deferrimicrobium sp.]